MRIGTIASQRQRLVIRDLRVLRTLEQQQHRAETQSHIDTLGVGIDRTTQQRQCILELAGADIQCTQSIERPYMVRRDRQDRSIVVFRVAPTAVAVKPHGRLKSQMEVLLTPGRDRGGVHAATPWRARSLAIGALPDRALEGVRAGAGCALAFMAIAEPTRSSRLRRGGVARRVGLQRRLQG